MHIDDAIRRMEDRVKGEFSDNNPENLDDMKLGIEALKAYQMIRAAGFNCAQGLLTGED